MDEGENENGWIANLNDDIIAKIIGLLSIKDLFRVSVLSKKWSNIWDIVEPPNLISLPPPPPPTTTTTTTTMLFSSDKFKTFLETVEMDESGKHMKLRFHWRGCDEAKMLIAFAILHKPKTLEIVKTSYFNIYSSLVGNSYPFRYFTNIALVNTTMPCSLKLVNLQSLKLTDCSWFFGGIAKIGDLIIEGPKLKSLSIHSRDDVLSDTFVYAKFKLIAPVLELLVLEGRFCHSYTFTLMPLIRNVNLDLSCLVRDSTLFCLAKPQEFIAMAKIFEAVINVKILTLSTRALMVIPELFHLTTEDVSFPELEILEIGVYQCAATEVNFIKNILKGAPKLKTVIIATPEVASKELGALGEMIQSIATNKDLQVKFTNEEI